MKKIMVYVLSIFAFLFLFTIEVDAQGYEGKLGYEYTSSQTRFFYLNNNDVSTIKLYIVDTTETDMIYDSDSGIWYSSVQGDLNGKEYYYEVCYANLTCINTIDPFANSINTDQNRNVIINPNSVYIAGYQDLTLSASNYYNNSIYAIEADKFVESLIVDTTIPDDEGEDIEIPGIVIPEDETPIVEYKDSIFNRLWASATYTSYSTGFNYLLSLNMKNIEIGDLYDKNNYFAANQLFSTKENNYSATLELKNFILNYKNNKMNIIARMDLLTPGEQLKQSLLNVDPNSVLENGTINLSNENMQRYILDVYKYWAQEYKVDGFYIVNADGYGNDYFNKLISELANINNRLFIYTDSSILGEYKTSDDLQNILLGSLSNANNEGIVHGNYGKENFEKLINAMYSGYYSDLSKAYQAVKVINNIGSISGLDIYSKLMLVSGLGARESDIVSKASLAIYTVFASAGIPRLVAGNEFLNTTTISTDKIQTMPDNEMICNNSKTLCYGTGDLKAIDWGYLVKNGSNIGKLMAYRSNYIYQYPNYATMLANAGINYNQELLENGILYLTIDYEAERKGDIEKSILIINYSNSQMDIDAISDKDYSTTSSLLGKISGDSDTTKVYEYTFYTFTQVMEQKFSNIVYILIAAGLLFFIFGVRYLLIWLLKNKRGIEYKDYVRGQKQTRKDNKKKNIKPEKQPSVFKTYLDGDSFVDKISEKIVNIGKKKKKDNKKDETKEKNEVKENLEISNETKVEEDNKEEKKND